MLDLIFAVLMIVVIVKANKGSVNDALCDTALVIGVLAGLLGLVQAFFIEGSNSFWILNILVVVIAFMLRPAANHFAKLHEQKQIDHEIEYSEAQKRFGRKNELPGIDSPDYDDPNVRFGGGDGSTWNGK